MDAVLWHVSSIVTAAGTSSAVVFGVTSAAHAACNKRVGNGCVCVHAYAPLHARALQPGSRPRLLALLVLPAVRRRDATNPPNGFRREATPPLQVSRERAAPPSLPY